MLTITASNPQIQSYVAARPQSSAGASDRFQASGSPEAFPTRAQLLSLTRPKESLTPTPGDVQGPYYRANAPVRTDLFGAAEEGTAVRYSTNVVDTSGNAIPGATVDVWTADAKGVYDMESPEFRGRAVQTADGEGKTEFNAIRPGNYDLGVDEKTGERLFRPAHVHVKVSAPGFQPVLSQLYFHDDPYNQIDPIESREDGQPEAGWSPQLEMTNNGQDNVFNYQFVLAGK